MLTNSDLVFAKKVYSKERFHIFTDEFLGVLPSTENPWEWLNREMNYKKCKQMQELVTRFNISQEGNGEEN